MKKYKPRKIAQAFFLSGDNFDKLSSFAIRETAMSVILSYSLKESDCYSYSHPNSAGIRIGLSIYESFFGDDSIELTSSNYKRIADFFTFVFSHELGHLLYTDFESTSDFLYKLDYDTRAFVKDIMNILEDYVINHTIIYRYPNTKTGFDIHEEGFKNLSSDYLASIKEHGDKSAESLALGLLLYCQCGFKVEYISPLFVKIKTWLERNFNFICETFDSELRAKKEFSFACELLKLLKGKEMDDVTDEPNYGNISMPQGNYDNNLIPSNTFSRYSNNKSSAKALPPMQAESFVPGGSASNDVDVSALLSSEVSEILACSFPAMPVPHAYYNIKDYYINPVKFILPDEMFSLSNGCINAIKHIKNGSKPVLSRYKLTGRFDIKTASKPFNNNIFYNKKNPVLPDLVVSILIDCSGSMRGVKAESAGNILACFSDSLHKLRIPFSISGFSTSNNFATTVRFKEFNQSYSEIRDYLSFFSEQPNYSCVWSSNVDEVNIKYATKELLSYKNKDKLLIVISDGATCGSAEALVKQINKTLSSGVKCLGIGIYNSEVDRLYPDHFTVRHSSDYESLIKYLNKYLINLFKGGE